MVTRKSPRKGSLQFWPRKRARNILPSVNWEPLSSNKFISGFIAYKAGMASAYVTNNTPDSMTKGKKIAVPVTVLECPTMRIFSVRFYKNNKVAKDVLTANLEKELKRKVKLPKKVAKLEDTNLESFDDVSVVVYSQVKKTGLKKSPDLVEVKVNGKNLNEKLNLIKENLSKELSILNFFEKGQVVDVRGVTKGKGFQGATKRFGLKLRFHKSEKGQRGPGSIAPWHPARTTFRTPMPGQMGNYTRVIYNSLLLASGKELNKEFKNYGKIKTEYIIVNGSVMGPAKRQVLITSPLRAYKKQTKKKYELIEVR